MWSIKFKRRMATPLLVIGLFWLVTCSAKWQTARASGEARLPTDSALSKKPALIIDWESRVLSGDAQVRATAEATLIKGEQRSFALLRRFLDNRNENLHSQTFIIIQRMGPPEPCVSGRRWRACSISSERWQISLAGLSAASRAGPARVSVAFDDRRSVRGRESVVLCHC